MIVSALLLRRRSKRVEAVQVEVENEPARRLYARAGFRPSYGYHYRRQPGAV